MKRRETNVDKPDRESDSFSESAESEFVPCKVQILIISLIY